MSSDVIERIKAEQQKSGKLPRPGTAEWEAQQHKVIGFNHVRRSPEEKEADERRRSRTAPRWRRRLRYRFHNSTRGRLICILLLCCAMATVSFVVLWSVGELVAAMAVAGSSLGLGAFSCIVTEILVRCPELTRGLLIHLGILERVYVEEEMVHGYSYEVHETHDGREYDELALHTVPDDADYPGEMKMPSASYPYYDEESGQVVGIEGKPMWGDVAPEVHNAMSQAKRAGQRVMSAIGQMTQGTQREYEELQALQMMESDDVRTIHNDPVLAAIALEQQQQHQQQQQGPSAGAEATGYDGEPEYDDDDDDDDDDDQDAHDSPVPEEPAKSQDKVD